jgi:hypothetical protein
MGVRRNLPLLATTITSPSDALRCGEVLDEPDDAEHVHVELLQPLGVRQVLHRPDQPVAGIAHEDVDPAERGDGPTHRAGHRSVVAQLDPDRQERRAVDLREARERVRPPRERDHPVAVLERGDDERVPETARGATDQPHPPTGAAGCHHISSLIFRGTIGRYECSGRHRRGR